MYVSSHGRKKEVRKILKQKKRCMLGLRVEKKDVRKALVLRKKGCTLGLRVEKKECTACSINNVLGL